MTTNDQQSILAADSTPQDFDRRQDTYLVRSFSAHVAQYVGIGLISGSVVHASTLGGSGLLYGALIALGMLLYCLKFLIEFRFRLNRQRVLFLGVSTIVAFGTGMLAGAVQHFVDGPHAGAILLSTGLVIAYIAFCVREDKRALTKRSIIGVLVLGGSLFAILWVVAGLLGGGSGHSGH